MASTEQILQAAAELGKLIGEHPATKKFVDAAKGLQDDTEAQRVLNDYNRQLQTIHEKESKGQPIEVADKRKLEGLQQAVIQNKVLRDFQLVQMDYMDLMRRVDDALEPPLATAVDPQAAAASPIVNPDVSS